MSKTTTKYHSTDGRFTGKTVTTSHSDGSKRISNYKASRGGLFGDILGPTWISTSTTKVDSKGNSNTSTKKSSWW